MKSRETIHGEVEIYRYPAFEIIKDYPVPKLWHPGFWKTLREVQTKDPQVIMTRTLWLLILQ